MGRAGALNPRDATRVCRRRLALAACAAAAAVLCGALAAAPAPAAVPADSVGIYSEELERANSADQVAAGLAQRDAGVRIVRQPFSWARIETAPGQLDFSVYDNVMAAAAIARLAVLPVLMDPPSWRSTAPPVNAAHGMYPPRDPAAMGRMATVLVQRYGPGGSFWSAHPDLPPSPIHSWQIWNEPNIWAFWATGPDPAAYVALLRAVSSAIRAADPNAEIVAGGLPYSVNGMTVPAFIDGMYAAGARGSFDTLAVHPYASDPAGVLEILLAVRQQLDALGDAERPIWATEFGWATGGPPVTITMSETSQAAVLREAIVLMQRARAALHIRGFIAFRWKDVPLNPGQHDLWAFHTGLLRSDGSAKPALDAFGRAAAAWLQEPTPAQALSLADIAELPAASGGEQGAGVVGISRRALVIRRSITRGRLVVAVDVPPGGGNLRVRIGYDALRNGRVVVHRARVVGTRKRVARAVFALGRRARSAGLLRITATQGDVRASRTLRIGRTQNRSGWSRRP